MIQAEQLFLQARIDLAAELVAIGVASSNVQGYEWLGSRLEWFEFVFRFSRKQDDDEDADESLFEEEWAGRALDQERRTKQAVQDSKDIVLSRIEELERNSGALIQKRIEELERNSEAQAAVIQKRIENSEARFEKLERNSEAQSALIQAQAALIQTSLAEFESRILNAISNK